MSFLKTIKSNLKKNIYLLKADKFLLQMKGKTHEAKKKMKVAFLILEVPTWDKLLRVYEKMSQDNDIEADIIVIPSYSRKMRRSRVYGEELAFFESRYERVIPAYSKRGLYELDGQDYDYVFYQDPYMFHYPEEYACNKVMKYAKVCYIPYGFNGADVFIDGNTNSEFFDCVNFAFCDVSEIANVMLKRYMFSSKLGLRHMLLIGYPAFESYFIQKWDGNIKNVLWTPRWSYDSKGGGSHFLEYKDDFLKTIKQKKELSFCLRPHPLMFSNLELSKLFSAEEREVYLNEMLKNGASLSTGKMTNDDFEKADLLITDFSSIIPMFFLLGKPIIYCNSGIELNRAYSLMQKGMYVANNWNEVLMHCEELLKGNDYLKPKRQRISEYFKAKHVGATDRVVDTLKKDYRKSGV